MKSSLLKTQFGLCLGKVIFCSTVMIIRIWSWFLSFHSVPRAIYSINEERKQAVFLMQPSFSDIQGVTVLCALVCVCIAFVLHRSQKLKGHNSRPMYTLCNLPEIDQIKGVYFRTEFSPKFLFQVSGFKCIVGVSGTTILSAYLFAKLR